MKETLRKLVAGAILSEEQAEVVFERILTGDADEAQIGALLALLARRGATIDELVGGARAMRRLVTPVATDHITDQGVVIDTCGTGGARKTFNISTAAAIVVAASRGARRVHVAKHGGRSRSGRGSAEVLESLGVNVAATPKQQARCLAQVGVCFCFAIHHHPAMHAAAGPRASLGFPTIFNLLGPLTNPAGATRQLMGVYDVSLVEPIAQALLRLGADRAMVVHGLDGMDEITTTTSTLIAEVRDGDVSVTTFDAASLGAPVAKIKELEQTQDLASAASLVRRVLEGEPGPARWIVEVNAAAALIVAEAAPGFKQALELARDAIDSGRAIETLEQLAAVSRA